MSDNRVNIFLYSCLAYFIFHLILEDILLICRFIKKRENDNFTDIESKTVVSICLKVCDVILKSVMGYFYIFNVCWCASVDCLKQVMLAYITFLSSLSDKLLSYPTCIFTSASAVLIVLIISVTLIELFK